MDHAHLNKNVWRVNDMKLVKLFSVLGLVTMMVACGSGQPVTGMYGNQYDPYGTYNYGQTGSIGGGQAIYGSNGQLIGYKRQISLFNGQSSYYGSTGAYLVPASSISNLTINSEVSVNAGEKIYFNPMNANYRINNSTCLGGIINTYGNINPPTPITEGIISIGGEELANGMPAPTSGVVTLSAELSPLSAMCTVQQYIVSLKNAVYKESCTNLNGAPMQCP
jgi:hypothetical protein